MKTKILYLFIVLAWLTISVASAQTASYALGTTALLVGPSAGSNSVVLAVMPQTTPWTATANAGWLHLSPANQSGTGSMNVIFSYDANPGVTRSGSLTIAGQTLTVTQAGTTYVAAEPVVTLVPPIPQPVGQAGPFSITVDGAGNAYTLLFDGSFGESSWIVEWQLTNNSQVSVNLPDIVPLIVAGNALAAAGNDSLPVVLPATQNLLAPFAPTSDQGWLTITGITNGVVSFSFTANPGVIRTVNIALLGQSIPVTQAGAISTADYSLGATNRLEGPTQENDSVVLAVTIPTTPWTATANESWLHLGPANQSGTGSTNVVFSYDANPGATRSGSLTIAGQTLTVTQAGNVYIADLSDSAIMEWTAASDNLTLLYSSVPSGLAVDGAGNVYVADDIYNMIQKWTAAGNTVSTLVASGLHQPYGVAVDGAGNVYIADTSNNAIKELPYAFVDPTARWECAAAGNDSLPVVLPATANLLAPFAPTSNEPWLTIGAISNGVVYFSFTSNAGPARSANITLLGQSISVTQEPVVTPPVLTGAQMLSNGVFNFCFTNNPGASFTVLSTTNLSLPACNWTVVGEASNVGPNLFQFTDTQTCSNAQRFYLIRSP